MININTSLLIKETRTIKNITLRELSEITPYSFQTLSKYENNQLDITEENLRIISKSLDVDFDIIKYIEVSFMDDIYEFYETIAFGYLNDSEDIYERIKRVDPYISYSKYYNVYLVARYIATVVFKEDETLYLDLVMARTSSLNILLLQLFYDYYSISLMRQGKLIDAVNYIEQSISLGRHEISAGMIYYHAGIIYSYYGKLLKALKYCELAEDCFSRDHNHSRLLNMQIFIATIHAKMRNYEFARKSYIRILREIEKYKDSELKYSVLYNLAWFDFLDHRYESSLAFLSKIEQEKPLTDNGLFIKIACLRASENIEESEKLYSNCIDSIKDELYKQHIKIIHLENIQLINQEYESMLKDLYNYTKEKRDYESYEFTLDKLIHYYEDTRTYKKAVYYYQEKIAWKEWVFHDSVSEIYLPE